MKLKIILPIVVLILAVGSLVAIRSNQTLAWYQDCYDWCTPIPTPSPSVSPSPTPCEQWCEEEEYCDDETALNYKDEGECVYPTPEPEATPSNPGPGSYSTPTCNGVYTKGAAFVHIDRVSPTQVWVQWANPNDSDKITILYGYVGGGLDYSIVDLPGNTTEWTINGLAPNKSINVKILTWRANCVSESVTLDP